MKKAFLGLLVLGVLVGILGIVYGKLNYADQSHTHSKDEIYDVLADGFYDKDYSLLDYTGRDTNELGTSVRPVSFLFFDHEGNVIGREVTGLGILCDTYVVTRASLLNPLVAGIEDSSLVGSTRMFLLVNNPIRTIDDFETLKGFHIDFAKDVMILEREGNPDKKLVAPVPEGCGLPIGSASELSAGDALFQVGNFPRGTVSLNTAHVSFLVSDGSQFMFEGSPGPNDSGGPIFALRDGHFELVALNIGYFANSPSKGLARSFSDIVDAVKQATGLDLLTGEIEDN